MPTPITAAAIVARRAALSAARRANLNARDATASPASSEATGKKHQVSWFEVLAVSSFALLFNDSPDIIGDIIVAPKVITGPLDSLTGMGIAFWFWLRTGETVTKAGLKNGFKALIEILPIVGIFPTWTLGVLNVKLKWFDFLFNLPVSVLKRIGL